MHAILWSVASWLLRGVVGKFMVLTMIFSAVAFLVPYAVGIVAPYVGVGSLNSAFGGLGAGVWFFLDFFNIGFGLPMLISAAIVRFLIRRLPVIG